jgi:hypothetical protein
MGKGGFNFYSGGGDGGTWEKVSLIYNSFSVEKEGENKRERERERTNEKNVP